MQEILALVLRKLLIPMQKILMLVLKKIFHCQSQIAAITVGIVSELDLSKGDDRQPSQDS